MDTLTRTLEVGFGRKGGDGEMTKQPSILVVDNERDFVELARDAFEASAYRVIVAHDRKGGLGKAMREVPDLVIVGALEPRGDAFKLHRELTDSWITKRTPILVVDVRPEEHARKGWRRDEGLQMDAEDYISRPIEPSELVERVERVLERAAPRPVELTEVLERMGEILVRVQKIEKMLIK